MKNPKQEINKGGWTGYIKLGVNYQGVRSIEIDIFYTLLEHQKQKRGQIYFTQSILRWMSALSALEIKQLLNRHPKNLSNLLQIIKLGPKYPPLYIAD